MKSLLFSRFLCMALVLALATSAFAASDAYKASFQISTPMQVNGKQIPAGDYTARWEGSGPTVQVSIVQGKKTITIVQAQFVALNQPARDTRAEFTRNSNGDAELTRLQFSGKKYSLELGAESANGQKADSTN